MRRLARVLASALLATGIACSLPACGSASGPSEEPPALQAETTSGPVRLRISADADEIGVADRLRVRLHADWSPDATIDDLDLPLADTPWRLSSRTDSPTTIRPDGRLERSATFLLEPDLPGDYEIPGASVPWRVGEHDRGVATVAPMHVTVTGVLDDSADLLAAPAPRESPPPPATARASRPAQTGVILLGAGALSIELIVVVIWLRRRLAHSGTRPLRERIERLERLARDPDASPIALCESAADLARILARRRRSPELAEVSERLDTARFAPQTPERTTARTLADHVLDLLRSADNAAPGAGGAR